MPTLRSQVGVNDSATFGHAGSGFEEHAAIFRPACDGFQEHAAIIREIQSLAPEWSLQDIITLIYYNHMFISDPDKFPITKVEWSSKNSTAVNDVLTKIRKSRDLELRRAFPEDPMVWTPADEHDVSIAQQVSV